MVLSEERTTSVFRVEELAMEANRVKINKDKYFNWLGERPKHRTLWKW
jgi:hypothetical protein